MFGGDAPASLFPNRLVNADGLPHGQTYLNELKFNHVLNVLRHADDTSLTIITDQESIRAIIGNN